MLRVVIAVIVGYAVMAFLVFATFSLLYLMLGPDGAFRPGTFEPSTTWVVISFVLSFIAAVGGGWVCAAIARQSKAPKVFAAIVFVVGILLALSVLMAGEDTRPQVREGNVGNIAAMQNARQPLWVAFMNAFIAAGGISANQMNL